MAFLSRPRHPRALPCREQLAVGGPGKKGGEAIGVYKALTGAVARWARVRGVASRAAAAKA